MQIDRALEPAGDVDVPGGIQGNARGLAWPGAAGGEAPHHGTTCIVLDQERVFRAQNRAQRGGDDAVAFGVPGRIDRSRGIVGRHALYLLIVRAVDPLCPCPGIGLGGYLRANANARGQREEVGGSPEYAGHLSVVDLRSWVVQAHDELAVSTGDVIRGFIGGIRSFVVDALLPRRDGLPAREQGNGSGRRACRYTGSAS